MLLLASWDPSRVVANIAAAPGPERGRRAGGGGIQVSSVGGWGWGGGVGCGAGWGRGGRSGRAPGGFVFFATTAPGPSHVGMSLGGEEFVHAPSQSGEVRVERLSARYWSRRWVGAKRVVTN